jgi:hypothetical protein
LSWISDLRFADTLLFSFFLDEVSMQVHLFRGPGRVFGFTGDQSGANLPAQFAPWAPFKTVEMTEGEAMPGVVVDECLADLAAFGVHVTDAHVRITEQAVQRSA